jgi:hypothetical protein
MLPDYLPQKFGWSEPLENAFDPTHLEALVPSAEEGRVHNIWWKRSGARSAKGAWMPRVKANRFWPHDGHSDIHVSVQDTSRARELIAYLKAASLQNECDFSFMDCAPDRYLPFARQAGMWGGGLWIAPYLLRHWLPDIPWATVLGPSYVRLFGKANVLNAPAFHVEELGPEMIYLQLTPRLEDLENNFDEVAAARQRVKHHLGGDAFYRAESAYDYRQHPEHAGKAFRVPEFHLLPD